MNKEEIIKEIEKNIGFGDIEDKKADIQTLLDLYTKEKEKNKTLNLENQALYESINCNDDNMLARRYEKLQKELSRKDKLILDLKEKLNNIQFEVETAWRKIEKVENNNE